MGLMGVMGGFRGDGKTEGGVTMKKRMRWKHTTTRQSTRGKSGMS